MKNAIKNAGLVSTAPTVLGTDPIKIVLNDSTKYANIKLSGAYDDSAPAELPLDLDISSLKPGEEITLRDKTYVLCADASSAPAGGKIGVDLSSNQSLADLATAFMADPPSNVTVRDTPQWVF